MRLRNLFVGGLLLVTASGFGACSETEVRNTWNYGVPQLFISQAGICNNKILITKGKVENSKESDGWTMVDARTDRLVRVAGDVIINDATPEEQKVYLKAPTLKEAEQQLNLFVQQEGTILSQPDSCTPKK